MNKKRLISTLQNQKGVGLVEILVTVLITVIGLVGLASMQLRSVRANQEANQKAQGIWVVSDMANRIRANSQGNYITPANGLGCSSPLAIPSKVCSPYYSQNILKAVDTSCTADELAVFDRLEVLCGFGQVASGQPMYEGAGAFLANPRMNIQTAAGNNIQITLSWSVRQKEGSNSTTEQIQMVIYR